MASSTGLSHASDIFSVALITCHCVTSSTALMCIHAFDSVEVSLMHRVDPRDNPVAAFPVPACERSPIEHRRGPGLREIHPPFPVLTTLAQVVDVCRRDRRQPLVPNVGKFVKSSGREVFTCVAGPLSVSWASSTRASSPMSAVL